MDIIGNKDINMITFGKDKERVSVMLTVLGNGEKLPPMIIFKGAENGTRYKSLLKNKYVKSKEIYIGCQVNSLFDENMYIKYLNNIWFQDSIYKRKEKTLLIIDKANSHNSSTINSIFKQNKIRYILLPPEKISVMQPLDVVVNKPFKNNIRFQYRIWLQNRGCKNIKLTPDILIEFIYNAWYKKDIITNEMIRKAFKITWITTKADGSENHLIKLPEHYVDLFYAEENNNVNNDEQENNGEYVPIFESNEENANFNDKKIEDYFKINEKMDIED